LGLGARVRAQLDVLLVKNVITICVQPILFLNTVCTAKLLALPP